MQPPFLVDVPTATRLRVRRVRRCSGRLTLGTTDDRFSASAAIRQPDVSPGPPWSDLSLSCAVPVLAHTA